MLDDKSTLEEKEVALDSLELFLQSIDNANDLHHPTINGLSTLLNGLKNPNTRLRARSAFALGTAMQDNAKVQGQVLDLGGISLLIDSLRHESSLKHTREVMVTIGKIVYAILALLGHNLRGTYDTL